MTDFTVQKNLNVAQYQKLIKYKTKKFLDARELMV